jgi:peptide deformylase
MPVREILRLGNPALRVCCEPVRSFNTEELNATVTDLVDTLEDAQRRLGFGRAIASPQIGGTKRVLVVKSEEPLVLVNPRIVRRSRKRITLWDDCFSLPSLLAKVRRNLSVEVRYQDQEGRRHTLRAEGGLSELLQHEIDHLDGILMIDRAIDSRHIVLREEYEKWPHHFQVAM